jgi:hypothetical protein
LALSASAFRSRGWSLLDFKRSFLIVWAIKISNVRVSCTFEWIKHEWNVCHNFFLFFCLP